MNSVSERRCYVNEVLVELAVTVPEGFGFKFFGFCAPFPRLVCKLFKAYLKTLSGEKADCRVLSPMKEFTFQLEPDLSPEEFICVLRRSSLAERRPVLGHTTEIR